MKELNELSPKSVESPELYELMYEMYYKLHDRFNAIYGENMQRIRRTKGMIPVGIFAYEPMLFPRKGLNTDVAFDLKAAHDFEIYDGQTVKVLTGVKLQMDNDVYAIIRGRSGISLKGIDVLAGVIDPGYRGEIGVVLSKNTGDTIDYIRGKDGISSQRIMHTDGLRFKKGDRIAQLIFVPRNVFIYPIYEDKLKSSVRGERGYGSTGV